MNRSSLHGMSLEITNTVPLRKHIKTSSYVDDYIIGLQMDISRKRNIRKRIQKSHSLRTEDPQPPLI